VNLDTNAPSSPDAEERLTIGAAVFHYAVIGIKVSTGNCGPIRLAIAIEVQADNDLVNALQIVPRAARSQPDPGYAARHVAGVTNPIFTHKVGCIRMGRSGRRTLERMIRREVTTRTYNQTAVIAGYSLDGAL